MTSLRRAIAVSLLLLPFAATINAAEATMKDVPAPSSLHSNLDQANRTFQLAVDRFAMDRDASAALALEAASLYRAIARDGSIHNYRLELNAGNAAMVGGDTARAVLSFRRAERIAPSDAAVQQSLAAARSKVGSKAAPAHAGSFVSRAVDVALAWRAVLSRGTLVWIAAIAYVTAWGVAAFMIVRPTTRARMTGALAGTVAIVAACLLWADEWDRTSVRAAVIVQAGVIGLNGPAAGVYEPTYKSPLPPGTECVVIEIRGAWSKVRLSDGGLTWIQSSSLEHV